MFSSWVEYGIPGGQLRLERWWGARISGRGGSHEGAQGEQAGDQADPRGVWSPEPGGHGPQKRMSSPTAPAPGGQRKPGLSARALPLLTQRTRKSPPPRPRPVLIREVVCTARENEALSRPEDSKAAERDGGGTQWAGGLPSRGARWRRDAVGGRTSGYVPSSVGEAESVENRAWPSCIQGGRAGRVCCLALSLGCLPPGSQGTRMHERTSPSPLPSSVLGTLHKYNRTARLGIFSLEKRRSSLGRFVGKSEMNSL